MRVRGHTGRIVVGALLQVHRYGGLGRSEAIVEGIYETTVDSPRFEATLAEVSAAFAQRLPEALRGQSVCVGGIVPGREAGGAMDVEQVVAMAEPLLSRAGFRLTRELSRRGDGRPLPFGDRQWIYSLAGLDLEIVKDRGHVYVGLGGSGRRTLSYQAWGNAVRLPFDEGLAPAEQVEFFVSHLSEIRQFLVSVPRALDLVREENWKLVAPQIGLDFHDPPPGRVRQTAATLEEPSE